MNLEDVQSLQCEITTFCNARCAHCPRFTPTGDLIPSLNLSHWDTEIIFTNLQLEKLSNLKEVVIEGDKGDPVMHPQLDKILEYFLFAPSKPIVTVVTNGSIQNPIWWHKIGSLSERLRVVFSIDGLEDTNQIYRVRTIYSKIVENYKAYISAGGNAIWKFLVFKHNQHQINQAQQISKDAGFAEIWFRYPFINRFLDNNEWKIFDKQDFLGILSPTDLSESQVVAQSKKFKKLLGARTNVSLNYICPNLANGHFYITYDYYIFPCCMMHNVMHEKGAPYKSIKRLLENKNDINLKYNNFKNILESSFYQKNLEDHFLNGYHHPICHNSCNKVIVDKVQKIKTIISDG